MVHVLSSQASTSSSLKRLSPKLRKGLFFGEHVPEFRGLAGELSGAALAYPGQSLGHSSITMPRVLGVSHYKETTGATENSNTFQS